MSAQNKDLEVIPLGYGAGSYSGKTGSRQKARRGTIKNRRKRAQKRRRRLCLLCGFAGVFSVCMLWTNWLSEIPLVGQKARVERLAKQEGFPAELEELLEQNEETYDFVENYPNRQEYEGKPIDLSEDITDGKVPLLMQWDKRWGYDMYGDSMIGLSGCGPTCMAMAYLYHTKDLEMNPRKMAEYAQDNGFHSAEGTSWDFWTAGAEGLGLYGETVPLSESAMKGVLDNGGLLVCSMSPGDFTTKGHYILLRGYDENGFFVNDPNREGNSNKQWEYGALSGQIKNLWGIYP